MCVCVCLFVCLFPYICYSLTFNCSVSPLASTKLPQVAGDCAPAVREVTVTDGDVGMSDASKAITEAASMMDVSGELMFRWICIHISVFV